MAFDEARGVSVLFGGSPTFGQFLSDTWTWDGSSFQVQSPGSSPSARSGAAMAYDRDRQVVVLFGGFVPSGADASDTWEWNGATWTQRTTGIRPPARGAHRMVYDAARRRVVLFGGFSTPGFTTLADTWTWDGTSWQQIAGPAPASRCDQSMVFDEQRGQVLMFGGVTAFQPPLNTPLVTGDFWAFDGTAWSQKFLTGNAPAARGYTFAAYDSSRNETILHTGIDGSNTYNQTYRLSTPNAGAISAFGTGCAGSAGTPTLAPAPYQAPWLGDSFDVQISGGPAGGGFAIMVIGFSDTTWNGMPLPASLASLGLPGCDTYISLDDTSPVGLSNGSGTWTGIVCNCPGILGLNFYLQAGIIDLGVSRPIPASVTNALQGVIGSW